MKSNRPYLLRAFYEWIVDNDCTPHLVVNAEHPSVQVPTQFVQDGQIVLNVSPSAVTQFVMDNDGVSFNARFSGQPMQVFAPISSILAIYARENGEGTVFTQEVTEEELYDETLESEQEETLTPPAADEPEAAPPAKKKGAHLRVIK